MMESLAVEKAGLSRELLLSMSSESFLADAVESARLSESATEAFRADESGRERFRESVRKEGRVSGTWRKRLAEISGIPTVKSSTASTRYCKIFLVIYDFLLNLLQKYKVQN